MKGSLLAIALGAAITLSLTGCFSAMARTSDGWTGEKTSAKTKAVAGVADAATMPLQAPLLLAAGVGEAGKRRDKSETSRKLDEIRKDPEYIFREKLQRSSSRSSRDAVDQALWDHSIPFTDQQLRKLYKELDWRRVNVVGNPHCSLAFLQEIWEPVSKDPYLQDWQLVEQLTRNPATPLLWLEILAQRQEANKSRSGFARQVLERRLKAGETMQVPR